ncbi:adenylate kinase [Nocardioides sp.]|uniref:adenylate kinase n=1 Tax=Nocardioides sp. TaxID=35761 RepID=UPI002717A947|nr:adenylate kinase [Nocardioides sp.]MDO9457282.1 adenylate kinase [Nocardioides sp.]
MPTPTTTHPPFQRLMLYGVTGSGKTTAAARISAATGIPWTSVDDLTWKPGWVAVPDDEQRRIFTAICAGERWVLDTAYGSWRDVPLARADLVVGLDYPRWRSLSQLLRRTLRRAATGELACNGNRETWRQLVSRDSILVWHFKSFRRKRARLRAAAAAPTGPPVVLVRSRRELDAWIDGLTRSSTPS